MVKIGPAGGAGGREFETDLVPADGRLCEVHIFIDDFVHALQLVYEQPNGQMVAMSRIGGDGGNLQIFSLEEEEFLIGINGRYGWFIDSLSLHTNRRSSPEYGGRGGENDFFLNAPPSTAIVGLFGRAGWYLDALGIIARERNRIVPETLYPEPRAGNELMVVNGVGPGIAALLFENGITSLRELAVTRPETLVEMLETAGGPFARIDPTSWPEQAALAARGDWKGLANLQAALNL